jgi:hypothetical protein
MTVTNAFSDARQMGGAASCRPGSFAQFGVGAPQKIEADGTPTWIARGANFVVAATQVNAGADFTQDVPDESMVLLSPAIPITVNDGNVTERIDEETLVIAPPGRTRFTARGAGLVIRVFSSAATSFGELASNADAYRKVNDVAPLDHWPDPVGGFRLRTYKLAEYENDVGFGRLFRSTNLMINVFLPSAGPRDLSRLSPHDHADFEQGSLTLGGDFTHYLRTPWTPDRSQWREDQLQTCSDHSLMVIPPRMVHTTSWSTKGARLVDVFAPPRIDFSSKPGWVRNAAEYPMPDA